MRKPVPETMPKTVTDAELPGDTVAPPPVDLASSIAHGPSTPATAGQQAAGALLREAIQERRPIALLFGETGVGKSTLVQSVLATLDDQRMIPLYVSATSGEFVGQPTFDAFLDAICQRIADGQAGRERPAVLAALTFAVAAFARAEQTVVLAIDHADHLTDKVLADLIRFPDYLDSAPDNLMRVFIGSPGLASRLDAALRSPGAVDRRFVEIRLPQPTAEEVATLLAYEDMAQPGGPMLTAGAIDRISAYAKSNLHWAVPLADAARALALHQGEREVTPELVGGALLELWPPGQQQAGLATDLGSVGGQQELSDIALSGFSVSADDLAAADDGGSSPARRPLGSARAPGSPKWKARRLGRPEIAVAAVALAVLAGALGFFAYDRVRTTPEEQRKVATEQSPAPEPTPVHPTPAPPREQASRENAEEAQPSPSEDDVPASVKEPAVGEVAKEPPETVPLVVKDAPEAPPIKSRASVEKVQLPKKATAKPKKVKKSKQSSAIPWIQRR